MKFLIKYHKWLSIIITFFILLFAISGIIMNHRELFSSVDISRSILPDDYKYSNWNKAAVKGTEKISKDSILIYGNIGIWLTDRNFKNFKDFNNGIKHGIDNRKINKILYTKQKELFVATLFGFYKYNFKIKKWQIIKIPIRNEQIVDILEKNDSLILLSRSNLLISKNRKNFEVRILPKPHNYTNKVSLFKTLWFIHSGEIFGMFGKLFIDFMGLVFIFLTITGLILFINKFRLKKRRKKKKNNTKIKRINKWNLKWHNKIGWTTLVILVLITITGIFLRPPFLIIIANIELGKIPYTELDSENPWSDKLRRIIYDEDINRFIIGTINGIYYSDDNFETELIKYKTQPPASIMGINIFEKTGQGTYMIGSFEGLFIWQPKTKLIFDYLKKEVYKEPEKKGIPIGEYMITGISKDFGNSDIYFEFNIGAISEKKQNKFVKMPTSIKQQPMSLWNFAIEVHTARIYQVIIGSFYILIIPLIGFIILFILISGTIVWYKIFFNRKT